jgi:uncharacterized protein YutE (UPF0331/DUF86 family)
MTYAVERLVELRRHVDHLADLQQRVKGPDDLRRDLSLHNDVLFSLLMVAQLVIDIAGELCARRGIRFESYVEAVRGLSGVGGMTPEVVEELAHLPGFRNVVVHEYLALDFDLVVAALNHLEPVETFLRAMATEVGTAG